MSKKLLFILLTLAISHSLVAMKHEPTAVEKAFREEFPVAPSKPFTQVAKAVLGSGLVAVGGYLLKNNLAGIQAIPTELSVQAKICGATAMTLCGLGLLAWVKPNHFCKIKEEKKFNDSIINNLGPKITTLINNLGRGVVIHKQVNKATYKQDFEVNAAEYIENVIKNSYSFPGFQMNSDNFFKKNTDTIKSKIKRDINDRKNKTFLPWLFSKIIRSNTIKDQAENYLIIKNYLYNLIALYNFYEKKIAEQEEQNKEQNSALYPFFFFNTQNTDAIMTIEFDMNGMLRIIKAKKKDATIPVNKNRKKITKQSSNLDTLIQAVTNIKDQKYNCITAWHEDVRSEVEKIQKAAAAKENNVVEKEVNEKKENLNSVYSSVVSSDSSKKVNEEKKNTDGDSREEKECKYLLFSIRMRYKVMMRFNKKVYTEAIKKAKEYRKKAAEAKTAYGKKTAYAKTAAEVKKAAEAMLLLAAAKKAKVIENAATRALLEAVKKEAKAKAIALKKESEETKEAEAKAIKAKEIALENAAAVEKSAEKIIKKAQRATAKKKQYKKNNKKLISTSKTTGKESKIRQLKRKAAKNKALISKEK